MQRRLQRLEELKVDFLTKEAGLLQAAAPRETCFVVAAGRPLPDELLTVAQVRFGVCVTCTPARQVGEHTRPASTSS